MWVEETMFSIFDYTCVTSVISRKMKYILETDRLRLRKFTLNDSEFIVALLNSPGWLQFIADRNIRTEEQAKNYLENGPIKSYKENGYGLLLVEKPAEDSKIRINRAIISTGTFCCLV